METALPVSVDYGSLYTADSTHSSSSCLFMLKMSKARKWVSAANKFFRTMVGHAKNCECPGIIKLSFEVVAQHGIGRLRHCQSGLLCGTLF